MSEAVAELSTRIGRKSFGRIDYRDLITTAHHQLGSSIVLVCDSLNTHLTASMRKLIADHDWLNVIQLPAYASQLNPVEGIWAGPPRPG